MVIQSNRRLIIHCTQRGAINSSRLVDQRYRFNLDEIHLDYATCPTMFDPCVQLHCATPHKIIAGFGDTNDAEHDTLRPHNQALFETINILPKKKTGWQLIRERLIVSVRDRLSSIHLPAKFATEKHAIKYR